MTAVLISLWFAQSSAESQAVSESTPAAAVTGTNSTTAVRPETTPQYETAPQSFPPAQVQEPIFEFTNFFTVPTPGAPAPAGTPAMNPSLSLGGTSQLASPAALAAPSPAGQALFHWGPIQLRPHLDYQVSYGNSLQYGPGQRTNTLINQVAPGLMMQIGNHWVLDYTPTLRFYSSSRFQNGVDQAVSLTGGTIYQAWTFGLVQSYAATSQPLIETGVQTDQEVYSTVLNGAWQMSSKLSLELGLNQNFRLVDEGTPTAGLSDLHQWSTMDWINYQFTHHFSAGFGVGAGYDEVSIGSDDVFEQLQGRIKWQPGYKLSFLFAGGLDYRQFLEADVPNLLSPIFSLAAQYQLFEPTALFASGSRTISPSYFGETSDSTAVFAGLRQRLLRQLFLSVTGGYTTTTYKTTATAVAGAPASNYSATTLNISLSSAFLNRGSASIFYAVNFVSSGAAIYDYTTTQIGLELAYRF